ncbi:hypothetical protein KIN20_006788 [Parelaphostrongylus tenuis]|uniref:Uncharacterized protein n=1 Tax=Parelaphostrongylus tenuis TaxID=148309 RepID=A0AAD5QH70_PARTN|nr:hypothetical protein KIN20_006788 [Parelaphostrongylus tenuis]
MLPGLAVSADEYTGNESDSIMDKNVHIPQGSEDDCNGTDDRQRALLKVDIVVGNWTINVQSPNVLRFCDQAAGVQHSIVTAVPTASSFLRTAHDQSLRVDCRANKYLWHSKERRLGGYHCGRNEDIHSSVYANEFYEATTPGKLLEQPFVF